MIVVVAVIVTAIAEIVSIAASQVILPKIAQNQEKKEKMEMATDAKMILSALTAMELAI